MHHSYFQKGGGGGVPGRRMEENKHTVNMVTLFSTMLSKAFSEMNEVGVMHMYDTNLRK